MKNLLKFCLLVFLLQNEFANVNTLTVVNDRIMKGEKRLIPLKMVGHSGSSLGRTHTFKAESSLLVVPRD